MTEKRSLVQGSLPLAKLLGCVCPSVKGQSGQTQHVL